MPKETPGSQLARLMRMKARGRDARKAKQTEKDLTKSIEQFFASHGVECTAYVGGSQSDE